MLPVTGNAGEIRHQLDLLDPDRSHIEHFGLHRPDLDDVFFAFTGRPAQTVTPEETAHV